MVDDNVAFLDMARVVLAAAAFEVQAAGGAKEALALIPEFKPELILMDVQMPEMDGMELTQRLKADPATQAIVIVAFTAYAASGDEDRLRAAGFDGYIGKPADAMTLAAEVRFWFEGPVSARASRFVWP